MAEIAWTREAQRWLQDIFEYIAADKPQAAARTVQGIYERTQELKRFPRSSVTDTSRPPPCEGTALQTLPNRLPHQG